ncbi:hypothetical protein ARMGADRAFT_1014325 [Armillaria gallica]|uniref:Uncharacterized protein n=1 Tax=Armillaria gallica TaxID=47427 RepID=A0A2H3DPW7_ARMGA|nr:hypothetical protein ARMGADRAFT_1014325 [Armillaria gallica]
MYPLERLSKDHSPRLASLRLIQLTFAQLKTTLFASPSSRPPFILPHADARKLFSALVDSDCIKTSRRRY